MLIEENTQATIFGYLPQNVLDTRNALTFTYTFSNFFQARYYMKTQNNLFNFLALNILKMFDFG